MEGMEKPTAVEQFILDLQEHFPNHMNSMYNNNQLLLEQLTLKAKEMEKEQIKDAWLSAWKDSMINPLEDKYYEPEAEQYYNETFKSE